MKVEEKLIPTTTIEELAEKYDLTMVITERNVLSNLPKYFAKFKNVELKDGNILISNFGNGSTKKEAIQDYAKEISIKTLVLNAHSEERVEFYTGYVTYDS